VLVLIDEELYGAEDAEPQVRISLRTLIGEAGRESRAATRTIKMKEGPVSNFPDSSSSKIGVPPVENAISTIVFLWWE
jgi:hypothetical protein